MVEYFSYVRESTIPSAQRFRSGRRYVYANKDN